jgi:hypothetical protein
MYIIAIDWSFYEHEIKILMIIYDFKSRFSLFFKWDFNVLEYIQCAYVHSLKKILMFILFMNILMCQPVVNMDITCFKMSS